MTIREKKEKIEDMSLSEFAIKSKNSHGRYTYETECDIRTCFQRDRDRIIHSKSFRRLKDKTQVFIAPNDDHFRTRMTHTMEVSQISRSICTSLFLNENLTEAIALGHDMGHTPFGHLGEDALNEILKFDGGFRHNEHSVRIVQRIEKDGQGINLTKEVLDGILNHRGQGNPYTLEGKIVQISDKIAYITHDIDDAIRAKLITFDELPQKCIEKLGKSPKEIMDFLIRDIIKNSTQKNDIIMNKEIKEYMYKLRRFLFDKVYKSTLLAEEREKHMEKINKIYEYYHYNFSEIPKEFMHLLEKSDKKERIICDYIAGMTDRYAITLYNEKIKKIKGFYKER